MYRGILIALLSGVILLAFAVLPPMLPGSTTVSLFGSAQAEKAPTPTTDSVKLNSSRSNVNRMGGGGGVAKSNQRMGGGGGTTTSNNGGSIFGGPIIFGPAGL